MASINKAIVAGSCKLCRRANLRKPAGQFNPYGGELARYHCVRLMLATSWDLGRDYPPHPKLRTVLLNYGQRSRLIALVPGADRHRPKAAVRVRQQMAATFHCAGIGLNADHGR